MKDVTQEYIDLEEADERKPVEIFHVWREGGEDWYYTSGDVDVLYDGDTYVAAALERTQVKYDVQLEVSSMSITAGYLEDATIDFISQNPIELLWVQVMKCHREQLPLGGELEVFVDVDVVFIGQIKTVQFKGAQAVAKCVGFEHFLSRPIPVWRYQITCNHQVFNSHCTLIASSYVTTETVTLDSTGTILTGVAFDNEDDGYFTGGEVRFGVEARTIVNHVGTAITIIYAFSTIESNDEVDAYPGCNGRPETCRDKYDNIINFLGFPFIPVENPATRISW